jgi:hypothetical protein
MVIERATPQIIAGRTQQTSTSLMPERVIRVSSENPVHPKNGNILYHTINEGLCDDKNAWLAGRGERQVCGTVSVRSVGGSGKAEGFADGE